ncbi:2-phospho-L-lactate transferase [Biformimicrobium ophioploci]|uniref:2-phospho-L-lactate transferase n=1 Tax=Biformimicrobium ophioploci TaxID=3036711 RepID=A0ABQ6M210_9GAMM|nr:2-phospho-L-lactate transferase [Microbulbifer sp. NKW57]GMG88367.1 2-phospho-L-lactate transferase [Microbulbifer sp. NKW57]
MQFSSESRVLALTGGVGGAKLCLGLAHCLAGEQLCIVANTADDFEHLGLNICPDLDTVMYTLAGLSDREKGWGLAGESWNCLSALEAAGGETWFLLGDKDIATHLVRTGMMNAGRSLSEATAKLCKQLGLNVSLLPMSDDPVRTMVQTAGGELPFQEYFVRERCAPEVSGFRFDGLEKARPQPEFLRTVEDSALRAIIICPSNPFVSVEPIISLPGIREGMASSQAPVIAVSPIVAGMAIKGPAAKMMQELSMPSSALAVAEYYGNLLDGFVIDERDWAQAEAIERLGISVLVVPTIMNSLQGRIELAEQVLEFSHSLM